MPDPSPQLRRLPAAVSTAVLLSLSAALLLGLERPALGDDLYVTYGTSDSGNHLVEEFISSGPTGINTDAGTITNDLNTPSGIALDASGNLYVADTNSGTVTEFSPSGTNLGVLISGLTQPADLAVDEFGNLYVASNDNNGTITELSPGGSPAVIATGLNNPTGVAIYDDTLYVSSFVDAAIYEVPLGGTGLRSFTTFVSHDGGFDDINHPVGLAFDASGDLYVVNSGLNDVEEFSPMGVGKLFASNPDTTDNPTGLNNPSGIAIDSSGDVFVTNYHHDGPEHTGTSTIVEYAADGTLLDIFDVPNLRDATYIAIDIPEPAAVSLLAIAAASIIGFIHLRRRRQSGQS
jgi:sugar lactone lactonase YvrE